MNIDWMSSPEVTVISTSLFAVSEALALIPAIRANSVFQLMVGLMKKLMGK
jgi:hypothetical protein